MTASNPSEVDWEEDIHEYGGGDVAASGTDPETDEGMTLVYEPKRMEDSDGDIVYEPKRMEDSDGNIVWEAE